MSEGRSPGTRRRERLRDARLYMAVERRPPGSRSLEQLLDAALAGGVDMVQLRDKEASDEELLGAAEVFRRACDRHGALFWLNDRPDLVEAAGADGVHVGQHDMPAEEARALVGPDVLIGLSTHSPEQLEAALRSDADELSVGPVYETPTKEGRPAAGLDYVRHAAQVAGPDRPWFAIGGIDLDNVGEVIDAGARRIVVVRAIRDADDPRAAAAALRAALDRGAVGAEG
ncbi:MAG TPA: thiamine phosphate synthase [Thermoleophilaceae bacterium]|nr:thiamine phosphate synthase [Thermoleophilaceae bacterium]